MPQTVSGAVALAIRRSEHRMVLDFWLLFIKKK